MDGAPSRWQNAKRETPRRPPTQQPLPGRPEPPGHSRLLADPGAARNFLGRERSCHGAAMRLKCRATSAQGTPLHDGRSPSPPRDWGAGEADLHGTGLEIASWTWGERRDMFNDTEGVRGSGGPTHLITGVLADGHSWCVVQQIAPE